MLCSIIGRDPFLSSINSQLAASREPLTGSAAGQLASKGRADPSLAAEMQLWSVRWQDIQLEQPVGRGSFGWVRRLLAACAAQPRQPRMQAHPCPLCGFPLPVPRPQRAACWSGTARKGCPPWPGSSTPMCALSLFLPFRAASWLFLLLLQVYRAVYQETPVAAKILINSGEAAARADVGCASCPLQLRPVKSPGPSGCPPLQRAWCTAPASRCQLK